MATQLADTRVLIVAPHPDDEVIGCGGLIAKVKEAGGSVFVQYMTCGDTADLSDDGYSSLDGRLREIAKVAESLGIDDFHVAFPGDEYHLKLDAVPQHDLIEVFEQTSPLAFGEIRPSMVLIPQLVSYNQDHRACGQAAITALRPSAGLYKHQPTSVFCFEELADHWHPGVNTLPNVFVGLTRRQIEAKAHALRLYESQWRPSPNARSPEALTALAECRGAQSGQALAEGYHCLRWLL